MQHSQALVHTPEQKYGHAGQIKYVVSHVTKMPFAIACAPPRQSRPRVNVNLSNPSSTIALYCFPHNHV